MSNFIPVDKMKRLREASKNGDEVAIRILQNHLDGKEDFYKDLDVYFIDDKKVKEKKSLPTINTKTVEGRLAKFLSDNEVKEGDEDYDEYVKAFYKENPNEVKKENVVEEKVEEKVEKEEQQYDSVFDDLIDDELEAIEAYNKAIVSVMNNDNINESVKKGIITDLEEIRKDEVDHLEKLKRLKRDFK